MKSRTVLVLSAAVLVAGGAFVFAKSKKVKKEVKPRYTIEQVMKQAHKKKLVDKVIDGKASQEEKEKLLDLYLALWNNKPPRGDLQSWKNKTGDVIVAAARVVLNEDGALEQLDQATDCRACHNVHRPKKKRRR